MSPRRLRPPASPAEPSGSRQLPLPLAARTPEAGPAGPWSRLGRPGWVAGALLLVVLAAAVFGENGLLHLRRLRAEVAGLHRDVQALEAENERLTRAIGDLRTNPAAVERIAREELGLVRPGDRVLRFPPAPAPAPGPASSPAP